MKYPIGIQDFESLRKDNYLYVDKTRIIHNLVSKGRSYFLGRPRRFGKSLLISTLKAYFEGKKELFHGLAMEQLEQEWRVHPVLRLDLNTEKYDSIDSVDKKLDREFKVWENLYGTEPAETTLPMRLEGIIQRAYEKTGERVVILVDEYDKPLLQTITDKTLQDEFRATLKAVYGALKSMDGCIKFALLTGVTKFGQVSVFSDLNNLNDISMDSRFDEICGITESELVHYFDSDIVALAQNNKQTKEEAYKELASRYDGYRFSETCSGLYNPFSLLNTLEKLTYRDYWFATGTPTYLVELLKKSDFQLENISGAEVDSDVLNSIHCADINPISVLFQSGYLTIKGYDKEFGLLTLDYPNEEVKQGFIKFIMPYYVYCRSVEHKTIIRDFIISLRNGDANRFMQLMQSLMAGIPYELVRELENHYQNVMYIITKLMGFYVQAEYHTSNGRIDLLIGTDEYVYIIELKFEGSAKDALEQINNKDYALPFNTTGKQIIKIGANVSKETRNIDEWIVDKN